VSACGDPVPGAPTGPSVAGFAQVRVQAPARRIRAALAPATSQAKSLSHPDFRRSVSPNSSFKPTPLRYTKHMAGTACHALCSTTRRGLTQALGITRMFSRESLARQWKTIPPLGVLALCLIYAMFALRVLIVIAPSIGEKDTNWPHHGAFYPWDFFWEIIFVLISFSVLVASSATLT